METKFRFKIAPTITDIHTHTHTHESLMELNHINCTICCVALSPDSLNELLSQSICSRETSALNHVQSDPLVRNTFSNPTELNRQLKFFFFCVCRRTVGNRTGKNGKSNEKIKKKNYLFAGANMAAVVRFIRILCPPYRANRIFFSWPRHIHECGSTDEATARKSFVSPSKRVEKVLLPYAVCMCECVCAVLCMCVGLTHSVSECLSVDDASVQRKRNCVFVCDSMFG